MEVVLLLYTTISISLFLHSSLALNSDGTLLLSFKYSILTDPLSVLADWNYDDVTPCAWNGVMCMGFPVRDGNTTTESRVISLVLPNSQLLGSIPPDLGLVEHLRHVDLSQNLLNGTLPASLFNASELRVVTLSNNEISGEIPGDGNVSMPSLQVLNLSDNALTGKLPGNLSVFPNLTVLSLANNYLYGEFPERGFDRLAVLDLSSNLINGTLPAGGFAGGDGVRYLNLSYNRLTGEIPKGFGSGLAANATVDLSFNNLSGEIPVAGGLASQKAAAFGGNPGLCGAPLKELCPIPSSLTKPPPNGSTTGTSTSPPAFAAIPKTPQGGTTAAAAGGGGGGRGDGGLRPAVIAAITAGDLVGIGLLLVVFLYVYHSKKKKQFQQQQQGSMSKNLTNEIPASRETRGFPWCWRSRGGEDSEETSEETTSSDETEAEDQDKAATGKSSSSSIATAATLVMVDGEMGLELENLLKASAYILGATGASIVYKAVLADGTALAVRRIGERSSIEKLKDFEAQVRSIAKHRHANLLRLRGFYWGADEKLLIHDYAPNGCLANISFTKKLGSSPFNLSFDTRLRIARGLARGLSYLHEKKCVHGNVKPSNVLLGNDLEPMLGDFGVDRLLYGDFANKGGGSARHFGSKRSTVSQSSLPDVSPVAGASPSPTSSSSVLLSQLPYQAPEYLKNLKPKLSEWNAGFIVEERNRILRMVDPTLRGEVQGKEEAVLSLFKLGFACASTSPQRRPSMKDALQILDKIPSSSSSSSTI
ncbi:putative protein kinase RLK-Pelle-LRR-III family [Dioscorea sansibarensis]